ncbi:NAD(P)-dependent oxidoreductase [Cellvibrio mixtus]|uniref:NAD(P)-dependent oxidoreductase n=1 Tax=Cellvibrio mixtus TaxID=39650 RepID=UPI000587C1B8|nr:NAD(P)-binding domain-containing protein [Cellvibrio mixtus]
MSDVTVIGLGTMGTTIAQLFINQGLQVTLWNRNPKKAESLIKQGATFAKNINEALKISPITVMCVFDYAAVTEIFQNIDASSNFAQRTLIQLTTGNPEDARNALLWANAHGINYLDGAIQAAPSQMGQSDTPILLSGEEKIFRAAENLLKILAGNIIYLGGKIDAAATVDAATLSYVYGAMAGFTHGARMVEVAGLDVAQFGKIVKEISPSFGEFFQHEGNVIQSGDFTISESPMRISVVATERILQSSVDANINTEIPAFIADLFKRADNAGLGDKEAAALIEVIRN